MPVRLGERPTRPPNTVPALRADVDDPAPQTPSADRQRELLKKALARWKLVTDADHDQTARELDDLKFYAGDQWDESVKRARDAQQAQGGMPPVPARPTYVINKTRAPVRQVLNQERQMDLGIEIIPADDLGDVSPELEAETDLREGLVRRIQRESHAADARTWAFARAVQAGRGYYGILVRYVEGQTFEREIILRRFYNQNSVKLDPAHEMPDGSDAEWAFVGGLVSQAQYEADYGTLPDESENQLVGLNDEEWRSLGDEAPEWFTTQGEVRYFRVEEYWYIDYESVEIAEVDGQVVRVADLPAGTQRPARTRRLTVPHVKFAKIDGRQVLEETDWETPNIPIIKVLGEELQPYDESRQQQGMVRPMRDPGRGFNAMVSKQVEVVALTPIPPYLVAEGQTESYEAWYQQAATRVLPYLPYKQTDLEGRPAPPPTRTNIQTDIAAIANSIQMFDQAIQSVSVHDPSLGKADPSLKSGRAITAVVSQDQSGTSHYLDNLVRSMQYEAKILNDLLYPVYGRKPGRLLRLLTAHGEPSTVRLGPQPPGPPVQLTKEGTWSVAVKVTKSFQTRREQEASVTAELISANPALMTWFGDLFFKNMDGPGHQEMAERAKLMLDPKIQAKLQQDQSDQPLPPQAQAAIAQLQAELQQAQQAVLMLKQQVDTKQVEQSSKIHIAAIDADKDITLQRMKDATSLAVAKIAAMTKGVIAGNEQALELVAMAHDAALQQEQQGHEQRMQALAGQQAADQQASQQAHDLTVTAMQPTPSQNGDSEA